MCSLRTGAAFTILGRGGGDCLELVGPSRVRHQSHMPSWDSLERMLASARTRHRELSARCVELERQSRAWCCDELRDAKKRRLREKDRIARLVALARRHRRATDACELGSGHYGKVLLGRSARHGRVAIKVMPRGAEDSSLAREAAALAAVGGEAGFPALLYHGQQTVLGRPSDVIVMELLGPSIEDLCWTAR